MTQNIYPRRVFLKQSSLATTFLPLNIGGWAKYFINPACNKHELLRNFHVLHSGIQEKRTIEK